MTPEAPQPGGYMKKAQGEAERLAEEFPAADPSADKTPEIMSDEFKWLIDSDEGIENADDFFGFGTYQAFRDIVH
jgi:hypothetical protein